MKKIFPALLAGILSLTLTACGGSGSLKMELGTGGSSGVYYSYGQALSRTLQENTDIQLQNHITEGSRDNLVGLRSGAYQVALVQSDVLNYAWQGRRDFEQLGRMDGVRVVAGLYTEAVQLIAMDPDIEEADDLRGKTVCVGAPGSGVFFNAFDVLDSAGLAMSDITPVYEDFSASMEALKRGELDAAFVVAGTPTPAVTTLFREEEVHLVPIKHFIHKRLLEDCPFYEDWVIPGDTYSGQEEEIQTVGVTAVLVASADVPEEDIYELTRALFEHQQTLASLHGKGKELSVQSAAGITTVPYHPGAVRYYREQGISVKS